MCNIPRLRSIDETHKWLMNEDSESCITKFMLRQLVSEGEIPCVRQGRKILLNIDTLPDRLSEWAARKVETSLSVKVPLEVNSQHLKKYGQVRAI